MAQYQTTTDLLNGSTEVALPGDTRDDVYAGHEMIRVGEGIRYSVAADGVYDAQENTTTYQLSAPYAGGSGEAVAVAFQRDWTEDGFPLMYSGDVETAAVFSAGMGRTQEVVHELRDAIEGSGGQLPEGALVRTLAEFYPDAAEGGTDATATTRNGHPVLRFADTTRQRAFFRRVFPRDYTSGPLAAFVYFTSTATTGKAVFDVSFERLTGKSLDDTEQFSPWELGERPAPENAGELRVAVALLADPASLDFVEPGDMYRLRIGRNINAEGSESIPGDVDVLGVQLFWLGTEQELGDYYDEDPGETLPPGDGGTMPDPEDPEDPEDPDPIGTHWTSGATASGWRMDGVAYDSSNERFVAVGAAGLIQNSPDGATWTARDYDGTEWPLLTCVASDGRGRVVALGDCVTYGVEAAQRSDDGGTTWTKANSVHLRLLNDVVYSGSDQWNAAGQAGRLFRSTDNGVNWVNVNISADTGTANLLTIDHYDGTHVLGTSNGKLWYSTSLDTWVDAGPSDSGNYRRVRNNREATGNLWMAIHDSGFVRTSADGQTWSSQKTVSVVSGALRSLAFADGRWFIGTDEGEIAYSEDDGDTWTKVTDSGFTSSQRVSDMATGGGRLVAVGGSYSPDAAVVSYSTDDASGGSGQPGGDWGPAEALLFTDNWNGSDVVLPAYDHNETWFGLVDAWNPVPLVSDPLGSGRQVGHVVVNRDSGHTIRTMIRGDSADLSGIPGVRNAIRLKRYFYGFAIMWPSSVYATRDWDTELVYQHNKTHDASICALPPQPPFSISYTTKGGSAANPSLTAPRLYTVVRGDERQCFSGSIQSHIVRELINPVQWDQWYHFVLEVRWSYKNTTNPLDPECGLARYWVNGVLVQEIFGPNMYNYHPDSSNQPPMFSFGLYKANDWKDNNLLTDGNVDVSQRGLYWHGYRVVDADEGGTWYQASTMHND